MDACSTTHTTHSSKDLSVHILARATMQKIETGEGEKGEGSHRIKGKAVPLREKQAVMGVRDKQERERRSVRRANRDKAYMHVHGDTTVQT